MLFQEQQNIVCHSDTGRQGTDDLRIFLLRLVMFLYHDGEKMSKRIQKQTREIVNMFPLSCNDVKVTVIASCFSVSDQWMVIARIISQMCVSNNPLDVRWKNKFWGKSMEILPIGIVNVMLPRYTFFLNILYGCKVKIKANSKH